MRKNPEMSSAAPPATKTIMRGGYRTNAASNLRKAGLAPLLFGRPMKTRTRLQPAVLRQTGNLGSFGFFCASGRDQTRETTPQNSRKFTPNLRPMSSIDSKSKIRCPACGAATMGLLNRIEHRDNSVTTYWRCPAFAHPDQSDAADY